MSALYNAGPPRLTLAQLLAVRGALPPALALDLTDQLGAQLGAGSCDVRRLVRLSPALVELELDGERLVPGSVRLLSGRAPATAGAADATDVTGMAEPYLAWPELGQALSGPGVLGQADAGGEAAAVYCLGVLLYHMLLGRPPFAARDVDVLAARHLQAEPSRPASGTVPPAVEEVLWRALDKRREARYPSVAGLRRALRGDRTAPEVEAPAAAAAAPEVEAPAAAAAAPEVEAPAAAAAAPEADAPAALVAVVEAAAAPVADVAPAPEADVAPAPAPEADAPAAAAAAPVADVAPAAAPEVEAPAALVAVVEAPVAPFRAPPAPAGVGLYSLGTNRCLSLGGRGVAEADGSRAFRIGRGEPGRAGMEDAPHVDLGEEPFGRRVARRQAVLRYEPAGWTVEAGPAPERSAGEEPASPTRVNGTALAPGERRPVSVGDAIAFGPVRMLLVLYTAGAAPAGGAATPAAGSAAPAPGGDQATPVAALRRSARTPEVPPSGVVGRFRIGEALATAPPAPSFRATDLHTQAPAVVHLLTLPERIEPALLRAIDEGLRGAGRLDACPGVARLLDWRIADAGGTGAAGADAAGADAPPPYLAREYVDGRSVRALLRAQRRVQPAHALQIVEQVAEALAVLASDGGVHGAIHPENVFVAADGSVKVTDWAVAYVRRAVRGGEWPDGAALRASVYHAPEEYRGQEPDTRSDLFCLGLLLYELIAGAPPFPPLASGEDGGSEDVWRARLGKDRLAMPGVPEAVERIVFKALAIDPLDRYAAPQAVLADIEHFLRPAARRAVLHAASGTAYPVERSPIVLGRLHPGSMPYPDVNLAGEPGGDTVSRRHARLFFQDDRWWLEQPQDVVNWTYVQGRLLHTGQPVPLQDGDRVDVGQVTLTFRTAPPRRTDRPR